MKKYTVRSSIFNQVMKLQTSLGKRISNAELRRMTGLSTVTIHYLMRGSDSTPDKKTMETLLDLFNNNGVPTTPNDFYLITVEGEQEPLPETFPGRPDMTPEEYQDYLREVAGYLAEPLPLPDEPVAPVSQPPIPERPRPISWTERDRQQRRQKRKASLVAQQSCPPVQAAAS